MKAPRTRFRASRSTLQLVDDDICLLQECLAVPFNAHALRRRLTADQAPPGGQSQEGPSDRGRGVVVDINIEQLAAAPGGFQADGLLLGALGGELGLEKRVG